MSTIPLLCYLAECRKHKGKKVALRRTKEADLFTSVVIATFRLNGELIAYGDLLTADLGLTSSRWQVLGAVGDESRTVAQIARHMGLSRQSVQRIVNSLLADGFVELKKNPDHRRAKLVRLSRVGSASREKLQARQARWANAMSSHIHARALAATLKSMVKLQQLLADARKAQVRTAVGKATPCAVPQQF